MNHSVKTTNYVYPAIFTPEKEGGYYIHFPDIENCFTCGEDVEDGILMAEDALALMVYTNYEETGTAAPAKSEIKDLRLKKGEFATYIVCDTAECRKRFGTKAIKKTLTIPEWLNDAAVKERINFSQVLQDALKEKLGVCSDVAYDDETIIAPHKQSRNNNLSHIRRLDRYLMTIKAEGNMSGNVRDDNLKRIEVIRNLKDNWNNNGAPAIPDVVIDKVRSLIEMLPIQPEIFPTALKTIQLEYDNSRRDHMEIEIGESDLAEVFIVTRKGIESIEQITYDAASVKNRILQFYG